MLRGQAAWKIIYYPGSSTPTIVHHKIAPSDYHLFVVLNQLFRTREFQNQHRLVMNMGPLSFFFTASRSWRRRIERQLAEGGEHVTHSRRFIKAAFSVASFFQLFLFRLQRLPIHKFPSLTLPCPREELTLAGAQQALRFVRPLLLITKS